MNSRERNNFAGRLTQSDQSLATNVMKARAAERIAVISNPMPVSAAINYDKFTPSTQTSPSLESLILFPQPTAISTRTNGTHLTRAAMLSRAAGALLTLSALGAIDGISIADAQQNPNYPVRPTPPVRPQNGQVRTSAQPTPSIPNGPVRANCLTGIRVVSAPLNGDYTLGVRDPEGRPVGTVEVRNGYGISEVWEVTANNRFPEKGPDEGKAAFAGKVNIVRDPEGKPVADFERPINTPCGNRAQFEFGKEGVSSSERDMTGEKVAGQRSRQPEVQATALPTLLPRSPEPTVAATARPVTPTPAPQEVRPAAPSVPQVPAETKQGLEALWATFKEVIFDPKTWVAIGVVAIIANTALAYKKGRRGLGMFVPRPVTPPGGVGPVLPRKWYGFKL
jgi:hypothetical protein